MKMHAMQFAMLENGNKSLKLRYLKIQFENYLPLISLFCRYNVYVTLCQSKFWVILPRALSTIPIPTQWVTGATV